MDRRGYSLERQKGHIFLTLRHFSRIFKYIFIFTLQCLSSFGWEHGNSIRKASNTSSIQITDPKMNGAYSWRPIQVNRRAGQLVIFSLFPFFFLFQI